MGLYCAGQICVASQQVVAMATISVPIPNIRDRAGKATNKSIQLPVQVRAV